MRRAAGPSYAIEPVATVGLEERRTLLRAISYGISMTLEMRARLHFRLLPFCGPAVDNTSSDGKDSRVVWSIFTLDKEFYILKGQMCSQSFYQ